MPRKWIVKKLFQILKNLKKFLADINEFGNMACHCGLFDRHKIATRKLISRIKKSGSAGVVQKKILHICDGLFFTYARNRDDNYSFLKKTTAYF